MKPTYLLYTGPIHHKSRDSESADLALCRALRLARDLKMTVTVVGPYGRLAVVEPDPMGSVREG